MRRLAIAVLGVMTVSLAHAAIYKSYDKNGNVVYSDVPNGEQVQTKEVMTVPALSPSLIKEKTKPLEATEKEPLAYNISFKSPTAEQLFTPDATSVPVEVVLTPKLWKDHQVQMVLDGKIIGSGLTTNINTADLDRGTYAVEVKVLNKTNKLLSTASTQFTVQHPIVRKK